MAPRDHLVQRINSLGSTADIWRPCIFEDVVQQHELSNSGFFDLTNTRPEARNNAKTDESYPSNDFCSPRESPLVVGMICQRRHPR